MPSPETLHRDLIKAVDAHQATVAAQRRSVDLGLITEAGYTDAITKATVTNGWLTTIDRVERELDAWHQSAVDGTVRARAAITAPVAGTAEAQSLAESRAVRAWERLKTILDSFTPGSAHERALQEIREAEGDNRRVLVEELPAYLVSREQRPGEAGQRPNDAARFEKQVNESINRVLAETVPAFARALEYEQTVTPIISQLQSVAQSARRVVASDRPGGVRMDITVHNSRFDDAAVPSRP